MTPTAVLFDDGEWRTVIATAIGIREVVTMSRTPIVAGERVFLTLASLDHEMNTTITAAAVAGAWRCLRPGPDHDQIFEQHFRVIAWE